MKVLLTGGTGYIGKRLLPVLVSQGHQVVCCVRDKSRFNPPDSLIDHLTVVQADLTELQSLDHIPADIDAAYYLVHSMSASGDYTETELKSARNFCQRISETAAKQVIYLSGMVNSEKLSKHLQSRLQVEQELAKGNYHLTTLRAGIIIGSGSASFEIMRDLVEKLPVMITPRWLNTRCQPIAISDVLEFLHRSLNRAETFDKSFDIGSDDVLTYREMLLELAAVRGLKRRIWTIPVLSPRLSSYWLYFVTSTSYHLARSLVESMRIEVVARNNDLARLLDIRPISYREALERAFAKIESNEIVSSWKDSYASSRASITISEFVRVPSFGCFRDRRSRKVADPARTLQKIWSIGGETGWYYGNWLWRVRGFLDKAFRGVGLRRGRTNREHLRPGDALDFWRVLFADRKEGRLLLFAEMKVPGEAWLEFKLEGENLIQTATFRPLGLTGRLYWYAMLPFHAYLFTGLIDELSK